MQRHFTVTGFVSVAGRTALHWHRLGMWLPPGGHVERNEDPLQAVLREVREETGLDVDVLSSGPGFAYRHPRQLPAPATVAVYDIPRDRQLDEPHQHIDLVFFTRPLTDGAVELPARQDWLWVDKATLAASGDADSPLTHPESGRSAPVPADVRELGLAAIVAARDAGGSR